ncbi:MAG: helix-turn-helix transcriptional regulator [Ktedonobacteraceae bacterium]|nr:helix-turn-helix transcriptional regulator [Ktedonobacteraceae bacterium]
MGETVQPTQDWKVVYGHLFEQGEDGLPKPGQVLKYFREVRKMNTKALARVLGVTKRTVERMENEHLFFDSLSRRRALAAALRIPPFLLGITAFRGMPALVAPHVAGTAVHTTTQLAVVASLDALKEGLANRWKQLETNSEQRVLPEIEQDISSQREVLSLFSGQERLEGQCVLLGYYLLAVDVARHGRNYPAAFRNADSAIELALSLNVPEIRYPELVAAAYMERGSAYVERGDPGDVEASVADFQAALVYGQRSQAPLLAAVSGRAGTVFILKAQDKTDKAEALRLLDRSAKLLGTGELEGTLYRLGPVNEEWVQNMRGLGFLRAKDSVEALSALNKNYQAFLPGSRSLAYNHLYRAMAEEMQGHYPYATELVGFALDIFEQLKSQLGIFRVEQVVHSLSQHPTYADDVELAQLRARLVGRKRRRSLVLEEE